MGFLTKAVVPQERAPSDSRLVYIINRNLIVEKLVIGETRNLGNIVRRVLKEVSP